MAGFSTRHVVQSAYRAGYITYAVDHFCDQDLFWYTRDRRRFEELNEIPDLIRTICEYYPIDFLVVTSGAEHLQSRVPLLGTPPDRLRRLLDKQMTHQLFKELGILTPELITDNRYPVMAKPVTGAGGWRNRVLHNDAEKSAWLQEFPDVPKIFQQIVEGTPASVSCICNGERARAVAVNEQLLRGSAEAPYGFSGCITPIIHPKIEEMIALAERAVGKSGCVGSVGVDFVLSDDVWAIEINPRFQATLDTVEMATGLNLFNQHVRAFSGEIPIRRPTTRRFAGRSILFADRDLELTKDLARFAPSVADIPWPGTHFDEGNAIISVFGSGSSREEVEEALNTNIASIRRYIQQ